MRVDAMTAIQIGSVYHLLKHKPSQATGKVNATSPLQASNTVDYDALLQLLDLGANKIEVLSQLSRAEWIKLLGFLTPLQLVNALRLFSKGKLLRMVLSLPKGMLIKMLLRLLSPEALIKKMPTTELMNILRSHKLNNLELTKGMMQWEPQFIQLMLQRVHGHHDYSQLKPYELFKIFMETDKNRLMEGFKTMPFKALQPLVTGLVKAEPELLMNMSDDFISKIFEKMSKPTLLQACTALPTDLLVEMLTQLPDPMLLVATAQIDESLLGAYLKSAHPDLIALLANAA